MDGDKRQLDSQLGAAPDASNGAVENAAQPEEDHLGYNPQLNCGYDPQLRDDRRENKKKLRRRFEHIFEKYERDFEGIGDEIDLKTGEIVVDNGHLQNMQDEHDAGDRVPSEAVRAAGKHSEDDAIVNSVEHSDNNGSDEDFGDDEDGESDDDSVAGDVSNGNFSAPDADEESATSLFEADESAQESDLANDLRKASVSSAARLPAKLGKSAVQRKRSASAAGSISDDVSENGSLNHPPDNILEQVPGLKESMLKVQSNYRHGQSMDQDAIQALGMSIANQLATFISGGGKDEEKRNSGRSRDSAWNCPALPGDHLLKRQRSPSPQQELIEPPPSGKKSIWAPIRHPRQQKRKRVKEREPTQPLEQTENDALSLSEDHTNVEAPPQQIKDGKIRTCTNCETSDSYIWRKGPDGDLCNTCGMYIYRYGLMRPIESLLDGDVPMTRGDDPRTPEDTEGELDPLEKDWWFDTGSGRSEKQKGRIKTVGVRNSHFVMDEDALIIKLKEIDLLSWERMATYFPGRSAYALQCRYSKKLHGRAPEARKVLLEQGYQGTADADGILVFSYTREPFKDEEDEMLLKLRDGDGLEWEAVAASLPGRSPEVLERRYRELATQYLGGSGPQWKASQRPPTKESSYPLTKSLRYSAEEDAMIVKLREVDKLNWAKVAENMEGRNSFSLQKRYIRELCGRHPDSLLPPRKAYERATPSLETTRLEIEDSDVAREPQDPLLEINSPTSAVHTSTSAARNSNSAVMQDSPANSNSLFHKLRLGATESQDDTEAALAMESFTQDEDNLIVKLRELESLPWPDIAAQLPGRDISSISERYYHLLLPKLQAKTKPRNKNTRTRSPSPAPSVASASRSQDAGVRKRWTKEESDLVVTLREQGKSWSEIASHLPARSTVAVKAHHASVLDQTKKAYQQRTSVSSQNTTKSQAPLLRQAVSNLQRRSESALSFRDEDEPSVTPLAEQSALSRKPFLKPLLPKISSDEGSAASAISNEQLYDRLNAFNQHPQTTMQQDEMSNRTIGNAVMTPLQRHDHFFRLTDGYIHGPPDTPGRKGYLHSSPAESTPVATAIYATPARYNQQSHPYFVTLPGPYPLPHDSSPYNDGNATQKEQVHPDPPVASRTNMPKRNKSQKVAKRTNQSKAKQNQKGNPRLKDRKDLAYEPSDDDLDLDPPSSNDDASDDDFFDALSNAETQDDSESTADELQSSATLKTQILREKDPRDRVCADDMRNAKTTNSYVMNDAKTGTSEDHVEDGEETEDRCHLILNNVPERTVHETGMQVSEQHNDEPADGDSLEDGHALRPRDDVSMDEAEIATADIQDEASQAPRPSFTNKQLVTMALESNAPKPLLLSEVYDFLRETFEYFRHNEETWKDSIRTTLSKGPQFKKASTGRKSGWILTSLSGTAEAGREGLTEEATTNKEQDPESELNVFVDTEYVKAHPEETFHHRGQGRWLVGLPPPGSSSKVAVRGPGAKDRANFATLPKANKEAEQLSAATPLAVRTKKASSQKQRLPVATPRPRGRPRIHPKREGPPKPRGRPPKHRKQVENETSLVKDKLPEIPNSDPADLEAFEGITTGAPRSQEKNPIKSGLPSLDHIPQCSIASARSTRAKTRLQRSKAVVKAENEQTVTIQPSASGSDIIKDAQSELATWSTGDQEADEGPSLAQDSSELSNKPTEGPLSSSPILTKGPSPLNVYGKTSTPGTGSSTLFSYAHERHATSARTTPIRVTPSIMSRIRSIAEIGNGKRIVHTPMREFDDSEDELAL